MSLWDRDKIETFFEGLTAYSFSGAYIRKTVYPKIYRDIYKTLESIQQTSHDLEEPKCCLSVDTDGRPSFMIEGWVEATEEEKQKRDELRELREQRKQEAKVKKEKEELQLLADLQEKYNDQ